MFKLLKLQLLLVLLLVLVAGVLLVDQVVLKPRVERELEATVAAQVPGTTGVTARIRSFPFVPRLLATSKVPEVVVAASSTRPEGLAVPLRDVRLEATDVRLDTSQALDGKVRVTSIGAGAARASIAESDVAVLLKVPGLQVRLAPGRAAVTVGGQGVAELAITGTRLELRVAGRLLAGVTLPTSDLLPCTPDVAVGAGRLDLSCSFDEVPRTLLERVQG